MRATTPRSCRASILNRSIRIAGIAAAALVATACAMLQQFHLPVVLSGWDLAYFDGSERDPHLLTGWLWSVATGACNRSAQCVYTLDGIAFALLVLAFALLSWRALERMVNPKLAFLGSLLGSVFLGISPFAAALVSGPLGGETTLTLSLFMVAGGEVAGLWRLPLVARSILAAALVLQDPLLTPVALAYGWLASDTRQPLEVFAPLGCAAFAFCARILAGLPSPNHLAFLRVDAIAGPTTIVAIGFALFAVAPAVLYALRLGLDKSIAVRRSRLATSIALGVLAAVVGMFSATGDPTPYFLFAEMAILLILLANARVTQRPIGAVAAIALLALAQVAVLALFHRDVPSVRVAKQSVFLQTIATADATTGLTTCIAADDSARTHMLVNGFVLTPGLPHSSNTLVVPSAHDCPLRSADDVRLLVVTGLDVYDWGVTALNLARAAAAAATAKYVLPVAEGIVSPRAPARTPTGLGAFSQHVPSVFGPALNLIVVAGYSYRLNCISVTNRERFSFATSQIATSPDVRYRVSLRAGAKHYDLAQGTLLQSPGPDDAWRFVTVSMPVTSACAQFTFSAQSPTHAPSWVSFAGASLK